MNESPKREANRNMATFRFTFQPNLLIIESDQPGYREVLEGVLGTRSTGRALFFGGHHGSRDHPARGVRGHAASGL